jgi:hypothetical protein
MFGALGLGACGLHSFGRKPGPFDTQIADRRSRNEKTGLLYYMYNDPCRNNCLVVESVVWNEGEEPVLEDGLVFNNKFHTNVAPDLPKNLIPSFDKIV